MADSKDRESLLGRLKWRDLRVLLAVAQQGSMGKAASILGISQPAVSQAIRDLEISIRLPLFERSSVGVKPTLYGDRLIEGGLKAFGVMKETLRGIEYLSDPFSGELRLGCPEVVASVLPITIRKLLSEHPRLSVRTVDVSAPTLDLPQLRTGQIDAAIIRITDSPSQLSIPDDFQIETLCFDETVVIAGEQSPWASKRSVQIQELACQPWILPPRETLNYQVIEAVFREAGLDGPVVRVVSFSLQLRLELVSAGGFLSVLPKSLFRSHAQHLRVITLPLVLPSRDWPLVIATMRNQTLNPSVDLFVRQLRTDLTAV